MIHVKPGLLENLMELKQINLNAEVINITPQSGLLVLFPSYLYHSVNENDSDEERIIISFNIDIK